MDINYIFEGSLIGSRGIFEKNIRNAKALIKKAGGGKITMILNHAASPKDQKEMEERGVICKKVSRFVRLYKICNRTIIWRLLPIITRLEIACCYHGILKQIKSGPIYIRYTRADQFIWRVLKHAKLPIFFEVNGLVFSELKTGYGNDSSYYGRFNERNEVRYLPKMIRMAKGVICITNEIKDFIKPYNPNILIIGNSSENIISAIKTRTWKKIRFVLLVGADTYWQGIERLIASINNLKPEIKEKFEVTISGPKKLSDKYGAKSPENVNFSNSTNESQLEQLLTQSDIGLTTLALYKKEMNEAAPLKTRDYLRAGLPIVLAYNDTDVDEINELSPFVYKIANNSSIIPITDILSWFEDLDLVYAQHVIQSAVKTHLLVNKKSDLIYKWINQYVN